MPETTLATRPLSARCNIDVTEIGIGLWAIGGGGWGGPDDVGAREAVEEALDQGVTFFDTADVYGGGHSERLLGDLMKGRREKFIVGTKIGWMGFDGKNSRSQYDTVDKLVAGVEENLQRLGTDYIDLIQCHIWHEEPNTPVFIDGFRKLKEQGKVRAWGLSTSGIDLIKTFNAEGDCDTLQIDYSILNRQPEREILPYCKEHGIGVIVRGPLAMGILAGKFTADSRFEGDDFRKAWIEDAEQNAQFLNDLKTVEQLREAAQGMDLGEQALRFTLSHDAVTTVIPGARNRSQSKRNCAAGAKSGLAADHLARINAIVPEGGGRMIWPAEG